MHQVAKLLDDYGMVGLTPLDITDEDRCAGIRAVTHEIREHLLLGEQGWSVSRFAVKRPFHSWLVSTHALLKQDVAKMYGSGCQPLELFMQYCGCAIASGHGHTVRRRSGREHAGSS
jgi:hypothetical protein